MNQIKVSQNSAQPAGPAINAAETDSGRIREGRADLSQLSVIIPAYNELDSIRRTVEELRSACPDAEIVVVDDGSDDGTGAEIRLVPGIKVLRHDRNCGYGAALKTGMRGASRKFIAWYDGDGQHRPEDLIAVASPVLSREKDVVIGVRGSDSASQIDRVVGKALLTVVARFLVGQPIPDLNSGLRCFPFELIPICSPSSQRFFRINNVHAVPHRTRLSCWLRTNQDAGSAREIEDSRCR